MDIISHPFPRDSVILTPISLCSMAHHYSPSSKVVSEESSSNFHCLYRCWDLGFLKATCALQKIKIRSSCQAVTWYFLSVCPDISAHLSVRPENFQQNYSFPTGEISSVVISDCIYHMPHLKADVLIGTALIWNMPSLWKENRDREKKREGKTTSSL